MKLSSALIVVGIPCLVVAVGVGLTSSKEPAQGRETCKGSICVREMLIACRDGQAIWEFNIVPKDPAKIGPEQAWSYVRKLTPVNGTTEEKVVHGFGPAPLPEPFTLSEGKKTVRFGPTVDSTIPYELDWDVTCGGKNPLTVSK